MPQPPESKPILPPNSVTPPKLPLFNREGGVISKRGWIKRKSTITMYRVIAQRRTFK